MEVKQLHVSLPKTSFAALSFDGLRLMSFHRPPDGDLFGCAAWLLSYWLLQVPPSSSRHLKALPGLCRLLQAPPGSSELLQAPLSSTRLLPTPPGSTRLLQAPLSSTRLLPTPPGSTRLHQAPLRSFALHQAPLSSTRLLQAPLSSTRLLQVPLSFARPLQTPLGSFALHQAPLSSTRLLEARCRRLCCGPGPGQMSAASIWASPCWNRGFWPGLWFPLLVTSTEHQLRWQPSVKCGDEAERRESGVTTLSGKDESFSAGWRASTLPLFKYLKLCWSQRKMVACV